jgi:hypothetical protein
MCLRYLLNVSIAESLFLKDQGKDTRTLQGGPQKDFHRVATPLYEGRKLLNPERSITLH